MGNPNYFRSIRAFGGFRILRGPFAEGKYIDEQVSRLFNRNTATLVLVDLLLLITWLFNFCGIKL